MSVSHNRLALSPTPIETCRNQILLYENEVPELNLQLRQARDKIFRLVEMNNEVAGERDALRSQLADRRSEIACIQSESTELLSQVRNLTQVADQCDRPLHENQRLLNEQAERE
ncbi:MULTISPECIES: hypothetical protein [unclassified Pseudomonas]|uniref:hypothetical protein n=1 Tax=unclassified Pseudomonas TaxID=196821 RepID=UPI001B34125C|nr:MULTISPECIES: hypothetical protein [unclassified Pseudomonas]MBP5948276.1 hypothetical protein [Pseudomonas sp. P9(2020)]MBZ9560641.1 hypothetical protein [Pseudomonas sp. P116]